MFSYEMHGTKKKKLFASRSECVLYIVQGHVYFCHYRSFAHILIKNALNSVTINGPFLNIVYLIGHLKFFLFATGLSFKM